MVSKCSHMYQKQCVTCSLWCAPVKRRAAAFWTNWRRVREDWLTPKWSALQQSSWDGAFVVAGDLNRACLRTVLPRYVQYVHCPTRGDNTLDRVYSNLRQAYKAVPLPHLDMSDHLSLLLVPAYIPLRRKAKPETKTVQTWPAGALSQLQDCFLTTDWKVFEHPELQLIIHQVLHGHCHCEEESPGLPKQETLDDFCS